MKKRHNRPRRQVEDRLNLDPIFENPKAEKFLAKAMAEELEQAHERAMIRAAIRFRELLSPVMQERLSLEAQRLAIPA